MDFNSNDFLGLTTKQSAQLRQMLSSGNAGKAFKQDENGRPIVDFRSSTLKETEGKNFDSNNFNFLTDKEIIVKDEKETSIKDLAVKIFGMFKSSTEEELNKVK